MSKYQTLHERGVMLADEDIDCILAHLRAGILDTFLYFDAFDRFFNLQIISSDNLESIGYVPESKAVNIPLAHYHKLYAAKLVVGSLDKVRTKSGVFVHETDTPYLRFLILAGREEAVHFLQYEGHSRLCAPFPADYMQMSKLEQICTAWEIEARHFVDRICEAKGEAPAWKELDEYLAKSHPDLYYAEAARLGIGEQE